jgi:hypothetical protein
LRYVVSVLFILLCCLPVKAETPDTTIHAADYALYASIASWRTLDYFSTRRALALGGKEEVLPQFVVDSPVRLGLFEGLATAGEIAGSVYLIRHHHRKLARFENAVSIGLGTGSVVNNYRFEGVRK